MNYFRDLTYLSKLRNFLDSTNFPISFTKKIALILNENDLKELNQFFYEQQMPFSTEPLQVGEVKYIEIMDIKIIKEQE